MQKNDDSSKHLKKDEISLLKWQGALVSLDSKLRRSSIQHNMGPVQERSLRLWESLLTEPLRFETITNVLTQDSPKLAKWPLTTQNTPSESNSGQADTVTSQTLILPTKRIKRSIALFKEALRTLLKP